MFVTFVKGAVPLKMKAIMNTPANTFRKLPIGIQSFEFLRSEGYLYVDKTELIHHLVTKESLISSSVPDASEKVCCSLLSKSILKERKNYLKDLPLNSWNRN